MNRPMTSSKKQQKGIALFAALMLIVIFTLVGFQIANKGKDNTAITGANVRYNQVFEAGEKTLRNAIFFMQNIKTGKPLADDYPSQNYNTEANGTYTTIENLKNFDKTKVYADGKPTEFSKLTTQEPNNAFIWNTGKLGEKICDVNDAGESKCPNGIPFFKHLDSPAWVQHGIHSSFEDNNIEEKNYLRNIRTYTFIEQIEGGSGSSTAAFGDPALKGSSGIKGGIHYYVITVKASGYELIYNSAAGKTIIDDSQPARENVILQAVYARLY